MACMDDGACATLMADITAALERGEDPDMAACTGNNLCSAHASCYSANQGGGEMSEACRTCMEDCADQDMNCMQACSDENGQPCMGEGGGAGPPSGGR